MHFEFLVEDQSGKKALEHLVPKLINLKTHTHRIHPYKGIGKIPAKMNPKSDPEKRILLDQLPRLLRGYGKTYAPLKKSYPVAIVVVCDLDRRCLKTFRSELDAILLSCRPKPNAFFCIAIEEGEAWLLGDLPAVRSAFPRAKSSVLNSYDNDSICGTWELMAEALYPGGRDALIKEGWSRVGEVKCHWADNIASRIDVEKNLSESFQYFRKKLQITAKTA